MEQIVLNHPVLIPPKPVLRGEDGNGVFTFIYRGPQLDEIQALWDRKNCCIKILKNIEKSNPFTEDVKKKWWGFSTLSKGSLLTEAVAIQNLYAIHNVAPRVYAVFVIVVNGEKHWAMLVEDMGHIEKVDGDTENACNALINGPLKELAKIYGIKVFDDGVEYNIMQGKYVDFQGFHFTEDHKERIKKRLIGVANVGKWGPWMNYQDILELEIRGGRNMEHRIKALHLDEVDFRGKTVLDVGCSEGAFCRYAIDRGAKRVMGIDLKGVTKPAAALSYYLGYNNIDYKGYDLRYDVPTDLGPFDITLFLSMGLHIGYPTWLNLMTRELLVFEGNGRDVDASCIQMMKDSFKTVEEKGFSEDLNRRPVVWAR